MRRRNSQIWGRIDAFMEAHDASLMHPSSAEDAEWERSYDCEFSDLTKEFFAALVPLCDQLGLGFEVWVPHETKAITFSTKRGNPSRSNVERLQYKLRLLEKEKERLGEVYDVAHKRFERYKREGRKTIRAQSAMKFHLDAIADVEKEIKRIQRFIEEEY